MMNSKTFTVSLIIIGLILLSISFAIHPQGAWADNDYTYYRTIHIPADQVRTTLTNFPILVNITDTDIISKCQANGEDIRFYLDDNTTELYYEIEEWTSAGANVWVNVTSLSSSGTNINMYYGCGGCADGQDSENVWDSDYLMVYHFNDSTSGLHDSTSNHYTGTSNGDLPNYHSKDIGGWYFDETGDFINLPEFSMSASGYIEAFIQSIDDNGNHEPWDFADSSSRNQEQILEVRMGDNKLYSRLKWGGSESTYYNVQNPGTNHRYYVQSWENNAQHHSMDTNIYHTGTIGTYAYTPGLRYIGCNYGEGNLFLGWMYEFRISKTRRSIAWEETTYNTLTNTSTFCVFGEEHTGTTPTPPAPDTPPNMSNPNPANNSNDNSITTDFCINVNDNEGDIMNLTINCSNGQTVTWNSITNGTFCLNFSGQLDYNTTHYIYVNLSDGKNITSNWYVFYTENESSCGCFNLTYLDNRYLNEGDDMEITIGVGLLGILLTLLIFYIGFKVDEEEKKNIWKPILFFLDIPIALATGLHYLGNTLFGIQWWLGIIMFCFAIILSMAGLYYGLNFGRR